MFGADEAGKGPVLGSMFAAAVRAPGEAVLPAGIDDSKQVTPARRVELAGTLRADDRIEIGLAEIPVSLIDDPSTDMNRLTVRAHAEAIGAIATDGAAGVVDAGETDAARFARRVRAAVGPEVHVRGEHGADASHPLVGAASIVAKVERDAHVEELASEYGAVGSGYPGDPATREFLESYVADHGELPACARRSWRTSRDVLATVDQAALGDF